jgi:hypothetical protein
MPQRVFEKVTGIPPRFRTTTDFERKSCIESLVVLNLQVSTREKCRVLLRFAGKDSPETPDVFANWHGSNLRKNLRGHLAVARIVVEMKSGLL